MVKGIQKKIKKEVRNTEIISIWHFPFAINLHKAKSIFRNGDKSEFVAFAVEPMVSNGDSMELLKLS